jgi:hypothetical protein
MHPEQADCRFCGGCRDEYKDYAVSEVENEQWLEEMGDLIAASVEGMKKVPSFSACCHEGLAMAKNSIAKPAQPGPDRI